MYKILSSFQRASIRFSSANAVIRSLLGRDRIGTLRALEDLRMKHMHGLLFFFVKYIAYDFKTYFKDSPNLDLFHFIVSHNLKSKKYAQLISKPRDFYPSLAKLWERESTKDGEYQEILQKEIRERRIVTLEKESYPPNGFKVLKRKWKIVPPEVIYTEMKRNNFGRRKYALKSEDIGVIRLSNVVALSGSNCFIRDESIYVDEYRDHYPQDCDPLNETVVLGVRKGQVLIDNQKYSAMPIKRWKRAYWLAGPNFADWGHFVNTYLTKIVGYLAFEDAREIPFLIPADAPGHLLQLLELLVGGERIQFVNNNERHLIEDCLYFPTTVYSPTNVRGYRSRHQSNVYVDPALFGGVNELLKSKLALRQGDDYPKRIYWSRDGYSRRSLTNRSEVNEIFHKYGFSSFSPLEKDVTEQFRQIYNAELIYGEIGSWIYSTGINPKCQIILLLSDWDQHWWNEIGSLNTLREVPMKVILGKRNSLDDFQSENAPHVDYGFSSSALVALEKQIEIDLQQE